MKKIIAVLLSVIMFSGCGMTSRASRVLYKSNLNDTGNVDASHMDAFEDMFTMDICGYDITLPMLLSDLPEDFTVTPTSQNPEIYTGDMRYRDIPVFTVFIVRKGSDHIIMGADISAIFSDIKIHFANGLDFGCGGIEKEGMERILGERPQPPSGMYIHTQYLYTDGKKSCTFSNISGYENDMLDNVMLICDQRIYTYFTI